MNFLKSQCDLEYNYNDLSFTLDGKPVMVTQYVGGDMMPEDVTKRKGEVDDLQESANHPESQRVQSSER